MDLNMTSNEEVLSQLPNDAVRVAFLEIIDSKIPSKNYQLFIENGSTKGDNYIGITLRLTVTYRQDLDNEESEPQKLGIFIKIAPENPQRRQRLFVRPCFLREALIYDEFLPLLSKFQQSKGLSPAYGFNEYSDCFFTITNEIEETLFMDDLSLKGYTMYDRFAEPTADMVKMLMKVLGKFHALSFALKDQSPEEFFKYTQMDEILCSAKQGPIFENHLNKREDVAFDALSDKCDEEYLHRIKEFLRNKKFFQRMQEYVDGSRAEPYAVVCHGDCWNNNFLFKYLNGDLVNTKLIDWQLSRYASPVTDLMYYLFSCTTKSLRAKHYDEFLDVYHAELSIFLKRLGSDPAVLFPRSALDKQLKDFGGFGFLMGILLIPTINTKKEDAIDLDKLNELKDDDEFISVSPANAESETRSKIRDMIIDLIELGYIQ